MPKGGRKRTQEEYEREIIEAAKRMKKHPEALKSARQSQTWQDFLLNTVSINPDILESKKGQDFWIDVARKMTGKEPASYPTKRQLAEANATTQQIRYQRTTAKRGEFTVSYTVYRDFRGRFISAKSIISGDVIGF